ncbi:helix-turn-helix domain-containing protein [Streptomyces thermolineatus]|uniref:Helix-turn-helix domain-containing protein n=1 Tax=Streptomyces thermolineatus TaxID=44033 RepID=A0ABN3M8I0_9ACTN
MRGDYQDLVEEAAALLGAPATLEDRDFTLLAFGAHEGEPDPVRARSILSRRSTAEVRAWFEQFGIGRATGPVRTPPDPRTGVLGRLCLPARHGGVTYGYLWLLDQGPSESSRWDQELLRRGMEIAARAGALMAEEAHAGSELGRELGRLTCGGEQERAEAAEALGAALGVFGDVPYAVAVVRTDGPDAGAWAANAPVGVRSLPGRVAVRTAPGSVELLVPLRSADTAPAAAAARKVAELFRDRSRGTAGAPGRAGPPAREAAPDARTGAGTGPPAGVSTAHTDPGSAREALRQARAAAGACAADPALGPVARWEDIGPFRLLSALPADAAHDPAVAPLLAPAHAALARTAEVYLDLAGHAQHAAAALSIHRQTLYYRLSRVEQLTGLDLARGEDRLLLHMVLKAVRLRKGP